MVILEHDLPADHQIIYTGDWHEGSQLQYRKVINQIVEEVLSVPRTWWLHVGDWCEARQIDDPKYDFATTKKKEWTPLDQYYEIRRIIKPIRDKCLAAMIGNHDWYLINVGNMVRDVLCRNDEEPIPIPYGTYSCKIQITTPAVKYKIYLTHGRRSITSSADSPLRREVNMKLILQRHLREQFGDCLFMAKGHVHKLLALGPAEMLYLTDAGNQLVQNYTGDPRIPQDEFIHPDLRYYGCSGSALRLFADPETESSGYGERGEYTPTELGYLRATIRGTLVEKWEKVVVW